MAFLAWAAVVGLILGYEAPRLVRQGLWGEVIAMALLLGAGAILEGVQIGGGNLAGLSHGLYAVFAPITRAFLDLLP
ncbi:MAG: hypothetical protein ACYC5Y_02420 [Symbiobacteriia bacterium]